MEFQGVPAIVTGGASGLGEGAVRALAKAGCKVAILDLQEERGKALAAEVGGVLRSDDKGETWQLAPGSPGRLVYRPPAGQGHRCQACWR